MVSIWVVHVSFWINRKMDCCRIKPQRCTLLFGTHHHGWLWGHAGLHALVKVVCRSKSGGVAKLPFWRDLIGRTTHPNYLRGFYVQLRRLLVVLVRPTYVTHNTNLHVDKFASQSMGQQKSRTASKRFLKGRHVFFRLLS